MATAVEPSSAPPTPGKSLGLTLASLIGAVYVVASLAVVFYAVPMLWRDYVSPAEGSMNLYAARVAVQVAALVGLIWFGSKLAGEASPRGVRGGAFLMIAAAVLIFFVVRALALTLEASVGQALSVAVGAVLLFLAVRFFTGRTGQAWMVSLEEQGWFSFHQYKRALGLRVRRLTILGILLIGGSGVYTLRPETGLLPETWTMSMPFGMERVTVLTDARYVIPALLAVATLWIAWRAVNVPTFAEFLIATEAEMNKVSWTSRRRLAQDTVVVLITTLILTLFLLVVDLFWGWLLSRPYVGVLPSRSTGVERNVGQEAKW